MAFPQRGSLTERRRRRIWHFGDASFDEALWSLRRGTVRIALEAKPLGVLHELLLRAGETLTKAELLDAVWDDRDDPVGDASLATAVSKLRRAIGDSRGTTIVTVPTVGYRLAVRVSVERLAEPAALAAPLEPGQRVPGRAQWRLVEELSSSAPGSVWRAVNVETGETRIFRFADTPDGLLALRREVTISRLLAATKNADRPFAAVLEWSFDTPPFFTESVDAGRDLVAWVAGEGSSAPVEARLEIVASAAEALATAHDLGVLHAAIRPQNIVVDDAGSVRLVGFGGGRVLHERPDHDGAGPTLSRPGPYRAPEREDGGPDTLAGDVYALGIVLFQVVVADFGRPLAPGWEADVVDPLVAEDIVAAAAGDPSRRLASAAELAVRLRTLPARRAAAEEARLERLRLDAQAERERRRRVRAPWVRAAVIAGTAGLLGTTAASVWAIRSRDAAVEQERAATAAYTFLNDDLLARVDPARSGTAEETLTEAVLRAGDDIDRRFSDQPLVAARLHHGLGGALHQRSRWQEARRSYSLADRAFGRVGAGLGNEAAENRMSLAATEAASALPGSLDRAKRLVAAERARSPAGASGPAGVKMLQAEGLMAYFGDPTTAPARFTQAADLADTLPDQFSPARRLQLRQAAAMAVLRNGNAAVAEPILRRTADRMERLKGADDPDALLARGSALVAAGLLGQHAAVLDAANRLLPRMERRFGADHRFTLGMVSLRSEALSELGRSGAAAADAERVWRAALRREGDGQQAQIGELDLAAILCSSEQAPAGTRHARAARASVIAGSGNGTPLAHTAAFILGECLTASGRPQDALHLLDDVDPKLAGQQVASADWSPNLHLARAEAFERLGDRLAAQKEISLIGDAFDRVGPHPSSRLRLDRLRKATFVISAAR